MIYSLKILFKSFVNTFYKENAGTFVFVFTMMFFIVSTIDGIAGLYEYHYSLVTGMLKSWIFLFLVFAIWLLYIGKYVLFISTIITNPHYTFLQVYNQLSKTKRLRLFLIIEVLLLMPVLLYTLFICFVGFQQHLYLPVLVVIFYLLLLCVIAALWHVYQLNNPNKVFTFSLQKSTGKKRLASSYPLVLIRFVIARQTFIWSGIKIFTCVILYLIARNNNYTYYETSNVFLFYNFGILANGVLILRIRTFEETFLSFYRGLPVSLAKRFLQYSLIYFYLLIPEFITTLILVPARLHLKDAVSFMLCSLSLSLLMNSLTFTEDFKMKEYIKILLAILFIEYIFMMTIGFVVLYLFLFALAIIIFSKRYYKFEQKA